MKKSQNMPVWLSEMVFGPAFLHRMWRVAKGIVKAPVVDWLDGLIGPGGLLLVVADLLQSQF
jgi:hypothetical protein